MLNLQSISNQSSQAQQFLANNEESFKRLVTSISWAKGFGLSIIEVNSDNDLDTIFNVITNHQKLTNIQFWVVTLDDPNLRFFRDEMVKRLANFTLENDKQLVIIIKGLEQAIGFQDKPSPFLNDLNWIRDLLPRDIPYPIIFCLPTYAVNKLARLAPDIWSWILPVITFNSIEIKHVQQDNLTLNNQTHISQIEEKIPAYIDERIVFLNERLTQYKQSQNDSIKELFFIVSQLGIAYRQQKNLEQAELYLHQAENLSKQNPSIPSEVEEAEIYYNLGILYTDKIKGLKPDNLEKAIKYLELSSQIYTQAKFPYQWAKIQNALGNVYLYRIKGDRSENLEKAIACYENALLERKQEIVPLDWATIQNNLGNAYLYRIKGDKGENLEKAIASYENALLEIKQEIVPLQWATTQNNLGEAYRNRIKGERGQNLEKAIACYENALLERKQDIVPLDLAMIQNNLGNAYLYRIKGDRRQNLEKAIACFENALLEIKQEIVPLNWAITQNNLGLAYYNVGEYEKAIDYYKQALEVQKASGDNYNLADTLFQIGLTYVKLGRKGEALEAFQKARNLYAEIDQQKAQKCEEAIKNLNQIVEN